MSSLILSMQFLFMVTLYNHRWIKTEPIEVEHTTAQNVSGDYCVIITSSAANQRYLFSIYNHRCNYTKIDQKDLDLL
jgi:hypothetical protein